MLQFLRLLTFIFVLVSQATYSSGLDHSLWDNLLKKNVSQINGGIATEVAYQGMAQNHDQLKQYLEDLSQVSQSQFDSWSKNDQLAFLINAYNAATVELILTAWPDLKSIKDLGGFLSSPWSKEFVSLLGKTRSLDEIEHKMIRGSGRYNDPRVHFAVNCASVGCPALRSEAYEGDKLNLQLDEQTALFLSDRSRNYIEEKTINLSSIFKWYREDFEKGWQGFNRLEDFLLAHKDDIGMSTSVADKLKTGDVDIEFLNYDWRLNKKR